jgi:hypothetical protein
MKTSLTLLFTLMVSTAAASSALAKEPAHKKAHPQKHTVAEKTDKKEKAHKPTAALSKSEPAKKAPAKAHKHVRLAAMTATTPAVKKAKESYFLASDPHVPLAIVDKEGFHDVGTRGKTCGSSKRWAKNGSHWQALDAWGQVTGQYEVGAADFYDVTACHELSLNAKTGTEGVGLFVSEDSRWSAPKSVAVTASEAQRKAFAKFAFTVEQSWVNAKVDEDGLLGRTRFFQIPSLDKKDGLPKNWAVSSGPVLVVAYETEHGGWKLAEVKKPFGFLEPMQKNPMPNAYRTVAVFDMNGDGVPEIVYRTSDEASYWDTVLKFDRASGTWSDAAASPGGASL